MEKIVILTVYRKTMRKATILVILTQELKSVIWDGVVLLVMKVSLPFTVTFILNNYVIIIKKIIFKSLFKIIVLIPKKLLSNVS